MEHSLPQKVLLIASQNGRIVFTIFSSVPHYSYQTNYNISVPRTNVLSTKSTTSVIGVQNLGTYNIFCSNMNLVTRATAASPSVSCPPYPPFNNPGSVLPSSLISFSPPSLLPKTPLSPCTARDDAVRAALIFLAKAGVYMLRHTAIL